MDQKIQEIKQRIESWWKTNLANIITLAGLFSTIIFLYLCIYHPKLLWLIAPLTIFIGLSDFMDGKTAKKYGKSLLGSVLDIKRDKVFILPSLAILFWHHRWKIEKFPLMIEYAIKGLVLIVVALEILTLLTFFIGVILKGVEIISYPQKKDKLDLSPNKTSKDFTFCGFAVVIIWIWSLAIEEYSGLPVSYFSLPLIGYGLVRMIWRRIQSLQEYWERVFSENDKNNKAQSNL